MAKTKRNSSSSSSARRRNDRDDPERAALLPTVPTDSGGSERPVDVFALVHHVRHLLKTNIDTTLSWEQLQAPDVSFTLTRPLVASLSNPLSPAILHALLVNRMYFSRLAETDLSYSSLQATRADFAELLAMKLLRLFAADDVALVGTLVAEWDAFQGAPAELLRTKDVDDLEEGRRSTLEIAILSLSKRFLSTPLLQRAIALVHSGQILYVSSNPTTIGGSASQQRAILPDPYASKIVRNRAGRSVWRFEARQARETGGWLGTDRLRVPKWREVIEIVNFALIIGSFVLCVQNKQRDEMAWSEIGFIIIALGFALDEFAATREHGVVFYTQSLYNGFDLAFLAVFFSYLGLRTHGLWSGNSALSDLAFDILACGAAILFPRLAFTVLKGNVVIIALKVMIAEFFKFMALAVLCFTGIWFALAVLGQETWSKKSIAWLMAQIWFGSSYLSFQNSASFNPILGPLLLISYAALSNTLLVTILISILSDRYARISASAREEQLFQQAITTVGGVKSDAIFSFIVPINILAVVILWPLSFFASPKHFHLVAKVLICLTTWPLLLVISGWERWTSSLFNSKLMHVQAGSFVGNVFDAFGVGDDWVDALFADGPEPAALSRQPDAWRSDVPTTDVLARSEELEAEVSGDGDWASNQQSSSAKAAGKQAAVDVKRPVATDSSTGLKSPLARLFSHSVPASESSTAQGASEDLLRDLRELKDRQERIEGMLAVLTRGMRSDSL